jgi:hypothetical protein
MNTAILVLVLVAIVVPIALAWEKRRSAELVRRWAEQNNFTVNKSDFRALKRGPFWATTWNYQAVRRIAVSGQDGQQKTGWIRCNAYWPTDKIEVRWDSSKEM